MMHEVVITIPVALYKSVALRQKSGMAIDEFWAAFEEELVGEQRRWCLENDCPCDGDDYNSDRLQEATNGRKVYTNAQNYAAGYYHDTSMQDVNVTFRFKNIVDAIYFKMRWK